MKARTKKTTLLPLVAIMRRSRIFCQGGGLGSTARKQPGQRFYFRSQLILQFTEGVQWFYYRENFTFPKIKRESNIFQGGSTFSRGEMHITCDFPGGYRPLSPHPLDPHMAILGITDICAYAMSTN